MENVEWRPIKGYEDTYEISEYGDVRAKVRRGILKAGDLKKGRVSEYGYLWMEFYRDGVTKRFPCHRLVAQAFIGDRPDGLEVNHKDGNKLNNHYSNLEYVTRRENLMHLYYELNGIERVLRGSAIGGSKLKEVDIPEIVRLYDDGNGLSKKEIAKHYNVNPITIHYVVSGKTWRHIPRK